MERGKRIVLLVHCLLNVNAKVEGLAHTQAGSVLMVTELMKRGYGIIQLPCPEQFVCGCKRWGQVKEQLSHPCYRQSCQRLLQPVIQQIQDFAQNDYHIAGVIGIDGSPSCGVNTTCSADWGGELTLLSYRPETMGSLHRIAEPGVMMEELQMMLAAYNMTIPFLAIEEDKQHCDNIADILKALEA